MYNFSHNTILKFYLLKEKESELTLKKIDVHRSTKSKTNVITHQNFFLYF
jgi:hypothetical protein